MGKPVVKAKITESDYIEFTSQDDVLLFVANVTPDWKRFRETYQALMSETPTQTIFRSYRTPERKIQTVEMLERTYVQPAGITLAEAIAQKMFTGWRRGNR